MNKKKSRILTAIIGFFILVIPLLLLYYNINREISLAMESIEEGLQEKLLNTAKTTIAKLSPFNYINSEFDKIHAELFPEVPEEIITKIPDESEFKKII